MKYTLRCLLFLLCGWHTFTAVAENPPYATTVGGPEAVDDTYQFRIRLDPDARPDCKAFGFDCNLNGLGLDEVDIYWSLVAKSSCAGCDLENTVVQSGVINHGFWGTTCQIGSTATGTNCGDPGGCDNLLTINKSELCPNVTYELVTYALNPNYTKGIGQDANVGPGPYRCCKSDPSVGNLTGMLDCNQPASDGTANGWFNPSFPQTYTFTLADEAPIAPTVAVTSNITSGSVVACDFSFSADMTASVSNVCAKTSLTYSLLLNGVEIQTSEEVCSTEALTANFVTQFLTCPDNPTCTVGDGQTKVNCGANTLRWEVKQNCTDALVGFEEITFSVGCPEADVLETDNIFLCHGETVTISVANPANVNIPFPTGSYELHWNNTNPYENPTTNYLGTGQTATLINDNTTFPQNETITISGSIWDEYPTTASCEELATTVEVIMLTPIAIETEQQACAFNAIDITASGGYPQYVPSAEYTYDATDAGAGTNTTGKFSTLVDGTTPIPAGIYTIMVSDVQGCTESVQVEVFDPVAVTENPTPCTTFNSFSLNIAGGQPEIDNDLTRYTVSSDIDGFLGNATATGEFTLPNGVTAGTHTLTVGYIYIDLAGEESKVVCSEMITIEAYDPLVITYNEDVCLLENQLIVTSVIGGQDPTNTVGGGFPNAGYTVYLSTQAVPLATQDVATNEGTLTGVGTFTGIAAGDYHLVLEDAKGCKSSIPVSVFDNDDTFTLAINTPNCTGNQIDILTTDNKARGDWTYYITLNGGDYTNASNHFKPPITGTPIDEDTSEGSFAELPPYPTYTIWAAHSEGCTVLSETLAIYDELVISAVNTCTANQVRATAIGGFAGAYFNNTIEYSYTLQDESGTAIATNSTGTFNDITAGNYTISVNDNNAEIAKACTADIAVTSYDAIVVDYTANACTGSNNVVINSLSGGDVTGTYMVVLSTDANSTTPAIDQNGLPLSFSTTNPTADLPHTFTNLVEATTYYVIAADGRTATTGQACFVSAGPIEISGEAVLTATPFDCNQPNQINASITGGTAPYDYFVYETTTALPNPYEETQATTNSVKDKEGNDLAILNTTSTTINFANAPAGTYTLYAVDAEACQIVSTTVTTFDAVQLTVATNNCSSVNEIEVTTVTGGEGAYNIYLSSTENGTNDVTSTPNNLSTTGTFTDITATNYFVVVEDGNNCKFSVAVNGEQAATLSTPTDVCSIPANSMTITATGGTADWTFYLYQTDATFDQNNPEGTGWIATEAGDGSGTDVTANFTNQTAGTYMAYAVDANGCLATPLEVVILDALGIAATPNACGDEVNVTTILGGQVPYTIFLSTTAAPNATNNVTTTPTSLTTTGTFTDLTAGNFHAVIQDANGCQASTPIDLTTAKVALTQVASEDCTVGEVIVQAADNAANWTFYLYNGTGTFEVNNPTNANNGWLATQTANATGQATFTTVANGNYTVYAVNSDNCEAQPLAIALTSEALTLTNNSQLCEYDQLTLTASGGNASSYTYVLSQENGETVATNTTGTFTEVGIGTYSVVVTDASGCTANLTDLAIIANPIAIEMPYDCAEGFIANGGVGTSYQYQIFDGNNTLVATNTTGQFPAIAGDYTLTITDENSCTNSFEVNCSPPTCELEATLIETTLIETTCVGNNNGSAIINIVGDNTYSIFVGAATTATLTNQTAGQVTIEEIENGDFTISIVDETVDDCETSVTGNMACFACELAVTATSTCIDDYNYSVTLSLSGNGTYFIFDGIHPALTNQVAGEITVGPFPNGDYNIQVINEQDNDCSEILTGTNDCFTCELVTSANPVCIDDFNYNVVVDITGDGTYTINDGINPPLTNQVTGEFTFGPYPNGEYNILVSSEIDETCIDTLAGTRDCFVCSLEASVATTCAGPAGFTGIVTLTGAGTYTITDGVNEPLTNQTAGDIELGFFENGSYQIAIVSETDETCNTTLTMEKDCFECVLEASATPICADLSTYMVDIAFEGAGTYTITDGINAPLTNQSAGTSTLGPIPNGDYTIILTSEIDPTCADTLQGIQDCFDCNLLVSAQNECVDIESYQVIVEFTGDGTYNLVDNSNTSLVAQTAGTYTFGPYPNDVAYEIVVTSEIDEACTQTVTGVEDCFECVLPTSSTTNCIDLSSYEVSFVLEGEGTYTIIDNVNVPITGVTAGEITVGPIQSGTYSIEVISEVDDSCTTVLTGERDCFTCDLVVSASTACADEEGLTYNITLDLLGTGTYVIEDGVNAPLVNQSAGSIVLGPYPNGGYSIAVTSEVESDCTLSINGTEDCTLPPVCEVDINTITNCLTDSTYQVVLTVSGADETYNYVTNDGRGGTFTVTNGLTEVVLDSFLNGDYEITVTSVSNAACVLAVSGTEDCEPDVPCDPTVATGITCLSINTYEVNLTLTGQGTYTISDGVNEVLTNQTAGTITIGPLPSGENTITLTNEADPSCTLNVPVNQVCSFDCDLNVQSTTNCLADSLNYEVILAITGSSTYRIEDGINPPLTGVTAGDITMGPYTSGNYNIIITNEANSFCIQNLSGVEVCPFAGSCNLEVTTEKTCLEDGTTVLTINIEGSGTYRIEEFNTFPFQTIEGATAGTYEFTFDENEFFYQLQVTDENDFQCQFSEFSSLDCECDLAADVVINCNPEIGTGYQLVLTIEGAGNFDVFGLPGPPLFNIPAGEYVFDDLTNNNWNVNINSNSNFNCFQGLSGTADCPSNPCDLEATFDPFCSPDGQEQIIVTIEGSGFYNINSDFDFIENVPAGEYIIEVPPFGGGVFTIVTDVSNDQCFTGGFLNVACEDDCAFTTSYETECLGGNEYNIIVTIEGDATYNIFPDFGAEPLFNVSAGEHIIGPLITQDFFIGVTIENAENPICFQNIFANPDCDTPLSCDLTATADINCTEDGTGYTVAIDITEGTDTYTISGINIDNPLTGLAAGTSVELGPFTGNVYDVRVESEANSQCFQNFSGTSFCAEPPVCDLAATVTPICNEDNQSYMLAIEVTGSSTYSIIETEFALLNITGGVDTIIGPFANNQTYDITIVDQANELCTKDFVGTFACEAPPICDLAATINVDCEEAEDGVFFLNINLEGSGNYTITDLDGFTEPLTNQTAGEITYGPIFNDFYQIQIFDENLPACEQILIGGIDCPTDTVPRICDVLVELDAVCAGNGQIELTIDISGTGIYNIHDGLHVDNPSTLPILAQDVTAGTITLTIPDGGYTILVVDQADEQCFVDFIGTRDCNPNNPNPCDVGGSVETICNDDGTFQIVVNVEGSDNYNVNITDGWTGPEINNFNNVSGGESVTSETIFSGEYYVLITRIGGGGGPGGGCSQDFRGTASCIPTVPPFCDLVITPEVICQGDGSFNVLLTVVGSDTYFIDPDLPGPPLFNNPAGEYELGPFTGGSYNINVQSEQNNNCFRFVVGNVDCSTPPACDLATNVTLNCIDANSYDLALNISGTATYDVTLTNDVTGSIIETLDNVTAGDFTFENVNSLSYEVEVVNINDNNCISVNTGTESCNDPACDLAVQSEPICVDENSFSVQVNLSGTGTYTINDGVNAPLTGQTAGTIDVGPITNGNYSIVVTSETLTGCTQTLVGAKSCEIPHVCDVTATSTTTCIDELTYNVVVTLDGTSTYTINDGINPPLTGQTAGTITVGPIPNGAYNLTITDEAEASCFRTLSGVNDCEIPFVCDITTSIETICVNEDGYNVLLTFTGAGTYTINDGVNTPLTGQTSGTVTLANLPNGGYNISLTSEEDPTCTRTVNGFRDCSNPSTCDLAATATTDCISEESFELTVTITGNSVYAVSYGNNEPVFGQTAGTYTFTQNNGNYNVTIRDQQNANCMEVLTGSANCVGSSCDVNVTASTRCTIDGFYQAILTLAGTSTYTITDGVHAPLTNQVAGTVIIDSLLSGTYDITIVDEVIENCSFVLQVSEDCTDDVVNGVSGFVFEDANGNGLRDAEEVGLANVAIVLYDVNDNLIATTQSDIVGDYLFTNIVDGDYYLVFSILNGYIATLQGVGTDETIDSDIDATGKTAIFSIFDEGKVVLDIGAGMIENPACVDFAADIQSRCPNDPAKQSLFYYLDIIVSGGTGPYIVNGGELYTDTVDLAAFPLNLGPFDIGTPYSIVITDANNCVSKTFAENPFCGTTPVELLSFIGEVQSTGNLLKWATASEINNDYFTLVRSTNGIDFEPIATIDGKENSTTIATYHFLDKAAPSGLSYYRLDQTDIDGQMTSSSVITLMRGEVMFDFQQIRPVPAQDYLEVIFSNNKANQAIEITVYDLLGRRIYLDKVYANTSGTHTQVIDVSNYSSGTYIVSLNNGEQTINTKFVKK